MKIIKLLVTMSIVNAIFVMVIVANQKVTPTQLPAQIPSSSDQLESSLMTEPLAKPSVTPAASTGQQINKPVVSPKPSIAPPVAPTQTPTPKPQGCLVQIDGVKYEITSLLRSHSGGNIFTCGTDMSAIFWGRHNQKILRMMEKYKI